MQWMNEPTHFDPYCIYTQLLPPTHTHLKECGQLGQGFSDGIVVWISAVGLGPT